LTDSAESAYKQLTKEIVMSEKTGRTRLHPTRIKTGLFSSKIVLVHQTEVAYLSFFDTLEVWEDTKVSDV
jgi:hypothetical protein